MNNNISITYARLNLSSHVYSLLLVLSRSCRWCYRCVADDVSPAGVYHILYRCVFVIVCVWHRHHSTSLIITSCKITVLPNYNYMKLSGTMKTVSSIHSCVHFKRPKLDMINSLFHSLSQCRHTRVRTLNLHTKTQSGYFHYQNALISFAVFIHCVFVCTLCVCTHFETGHKFHLNLLRR